jgi:hypothetical protein
MPIGGTAWMGQNQSPRLTTNYLNQASRTGDPAPGVPVSTAQVSGSIVQPYGGFEGLKWTLTNPFAPQFADPSVGPLYGGIYMYVQFDPAMVTTPTRGAVALWSDEFNYIVTADIPAAGASAKVAGIIINPTAAGNWDFIQIAGIASVLLVGATLPLPFYTPIEADFTGGGLGTGAIPGIQETAPSLRSLGLTVPGVTGVVNLIGSPVELNLAVGFNY